MVGIAGQRPCRVHPNVGPCGRHAAQRGTVDVEICTPSCPTPGGARGRANHHKPHVSHLLCETLRYTRTGLDAGGTPLRRKMTCVSRFSGATTRSNSKPRRVISGSQSALRLLRTPT